MTAFFCGRYQLLKREKAERNDNIHSFRWFWCFRLISILASIVINMFFIRNHPVSSQRYWRWYNVVLTSKTSMNVKTTSFAYTGHTTTTVSDSIKRTNLCFFDYFISILYPPKFHCKTIWKNWSDIFNKNLCLKS